MLFTDTVFTLPLASDPAQLACIHDNLLQPVLQR